jgi:hypothetical protein
MEARLGHDFSRVRIHTGHDAGESAMAMRSNAYTFGRHVVMAPGRYQPQTEAGARLLAHELTHVVQQGNPAHDQGEPRTVSDERDPSELAAGQVAAGTAPAAAVTHGTAPQIARQSIHNPLFPCHEVSGTVMPGSLDFFGTAVHLAIQQHYVMFVDPLAATEYLIPGSGEFGATGRADIVDSTGGVYEIKPLGRAAEALEEAQNYVSVAETTCDPKVDWHLGRRYWPPAIPMIIGNTLVTSWLAGPGVILYLRRPMPPVPVPAPRTEPRSEDDRQKSEAPVPAPVPAPAPAPAPQPVPAPARSTSDLIREWAKSVVTSGADATKAAHEFFRAHPELAWAVLALGTVAIIALVADDVTLAGIADDVLVPIIAALMRVAFVYA